MFDTPIGSTVYPVKPIGDGCDFISGYAFKGKDFVEAGYPVIKIKNIQNGMVTTNDSQFVAEEIVTEKLSKFRLNNGDVLIAMTGQGSVGRVGKLYVDETETPYLNQRVGKFVADEKNLNKDYLYYVISTKAYNNYLFAAGSGSGQPNLSPSIIKSVEIPYPPYDVQCRIGQILKVIDDKIELNRQTNQTLEQIAQAIFKNWFVDFEPVKAKIAAKQNGQDPELAAMCAICGKTEEQLKGLDEAVQQKLKTTAALFPDALVESELGDIPVGWETVRFNQIVEKYIDNRGKTPPIVGYGIPLLEVKHLPDDSMKPDLNTTKFVDDETYENWFRAHLDAHDIIISTVGTIGRVCMVPENEKFTIAQNLLGMRFNKEKSSPYFMYYQMDGFRFRHDVDARLIITVQASIKRKDLETIDLLSPPVDLQNIFENFVKPFVAMQQSNQEIELAKMRDSLLPKLLAGELSIESTQKDLEVAV